MKNIVKEYEEKCEVVPKGISRFYQCSTVTLMILFTLISLIYNDFYITLILIIGTAFIWLVLFGICLIIYRLQLKAKAKKISKLSKHAKREECENIIDKYQKNWISNYIRKNKLSKLSKLSILINEIQREIDKKSTPKYMEVLIIPAVFSLIVSITNSDNINESAVLFLRYVIYVGVTISVVYWWNSLNGSNIFIQYVGLERLKELITHAAMKHGRG